MREQENLAKREDVGLREAKQATSREEVPFVPGELIVKFRDDANSREVQSILGQVNADVVADTKEVGVQLVSIGDQDPETVSAELEASKSVEFAEPNFIVSIDIPQPNDPRFGELWGLRNLGQTGGQLDADADVPKAWRTETGSDVVVGVIDTGVDYTHPDLDGNMWVNAGEVPGNGIDDDGNGLIDDVHGYDFVNNDGDPFDDEGHGTHVAGTIAAEGNNGLGVTGVNWSAQIMALKFLDEFGFGSTFDAIEAVDYAVMMGADLTNNSWGGGGFSEGLEDAIANAESAGQLFVAAAGNFGDDNDGFPHYPSSYNLDNIIAVAATDHRDDFASFSNFGVTSVDLGAPGVDILSTVPDGGYGSLSGTSMASPHVAGVAALLKAHDPSLSAGEIKERILANVDPIPALDGITVTGGRLNADQALRNENQFVGEFGRITGLTDSGQTVSLSQTFDDPVVFTQPLSFNGLEPAAVRITDVQPNQFTLEVQEPNANDGAHLSEDVAFYVFEAGTWVLPSGAQLQVDTVETSRLTSDPAGFSSLEFDQAFAAPPVVISQVQTKNGTDFVRTREQAIDEVGFQLAMEEEEALNPGGHLTETVGWMALSTGQGQWSSHNYQAGRTDDVVTHNWHNLSDDLSIDFAGMPHILAQISTFDGSDPAGLRYRAVQTPPSSGNIAGYDVTDSNDPGGPTFEWMEISGVGTPLGLFDDDFANVTLPFAFDFFDNTYDSVIVSSNGFLTFDTGGAVEFVNDPILSADDPNGLIAPFWDDLNPGSRGEIYHYNDVANDRFIVQYDSVPHYPGEGSYTFQAILEENGRIIYQYETMVGDLESATIGVENGDGSEGTQVAFNEPYVTDNLAVELTPFGERFEIKIEEDTSFDSETQHTTEAVDFLAMDGEGRLMAQPLMPGTQVVGEVGQVTGLDDSGQTVSLARVFENPVIFAQPLSFNGIEPAAVRITDIQADQFTLKVQEPNANDGVHVAEDVAYVVFEAGTWDLPDGAKLEVDTVDTNRLTSNESGFLPLDFAHDFGSSPTVVSQVQTYNGSDFVRTRERDIDADGFQLAMEEEEALNPGGHLTETVGWFAITQGRGDWRGDEYESGSTPKEVTDAPYDLAFNELFDTPPLLLAQLSSFDGSDPAGLRYDNLTAEATSIRVEEDTSLDTETDHVPETIDYLALEEPGFLTASHADLALIA